MQKIIFLSYQPFRNKFYTDFYIPQFIEAGYIVECWDLTQIYYPGLKMPDKLSNEIVFEFDSLKEVKISLQNNDINNTIVIPYMTYNDEVLDLFRILTKVNARLGFFNIGQFPSINEKLSGRIAKTPLLVFDLKKIYRFLNNRIKKRALLYKIIGWIKEYDIVFYAGTKQKNRFINTQEKIAIHLNDYDKYLQTKESDMRIIKGKYCVFLDEDFIGHPDRQMLGWKTIDPDDFYKKINNFFNCIEISNNCEVVIAASPKSNYSANPFNGRKIFTHKTHELVKHCEFAIAAASTSISYPVIYKKPLLFFTYSGFFTDGSGYDKYTATLSEYLKCKLFRIDNMKVDDKVKPSAVNVENYNLYKYNYLASKEKENTHSADIIIQFLRKYFSEKR